MFVKYRMENAYNITTLFLDIGGVLLTDGWNRKARGEAVDFFGLNKEEVNERHHLTYDTYESGKISLDTYLERIVFYQRRDFSYHEFKEFMFAQSKPFDDMITLAKDLKEKYKLKIVVVSNEGRELTEYRIKKFKLGAFVDFFISSSFVHFRKPDTDIYKLALDVAQVLPGEVVYIEDRPLFVQVGRSQGLNGIHHEGYESTVEKLAAYGLEL